MKRTLTGLLKALMLAMLPCAVAAQTNQDFNSTDNYTVSQVPSVLESKCWKFVEFNTDMSGNATPIEGDGSMISSQNSNLQAFKGIYTPMLDVPGMVTLNFKYAFVNPNGLGHIQYLRIYLADASYNIVQLLDSVYLKGKDKEDITSYSKTFRRLGSAGYRILINYGGTGLASRILIDDLKISANTLFTNGCNSAPVALNDTIVGTKDCSAAGYFLDNDYDADHNVFSPTIIKQSAHGIVTLNADKSFSFTPAPNVTVTKTSFTYKICEDDGEGLCSNEATVVLVFPTASNLPVSLVDFSGIYKDDGAVQISWTTNFESNSDRFIIERSTDGNAWHNAGVVNAQGYSNVRKTYSYTDNVGRNTANRKDLFYRLRQFDKDGKNTVSRILVVRVYNTKAVKTVTVTPNPARTDITVSMQLNETSVASIKIISNAGVEVMKKTTKLSAGTHSILMEGTSRLQPGMYVLEVIINSRERLLVKLIKE